MNNNGLRELWVILLVFLLVLTIIFYITRLRKISLFCLILSISTSAALIFSPFAHKKDTQRHNKEITGVFDLTYIDTTIVFILKGFKVSDSCRMILTADEKFRIENCPEFIEDSVGNWTLCNDGNYFGICFSDSGNKPINYFSAEQPYDKIKIEKNFNGIENKVLVFTKIK